jgi:hypothetical protein
MMKTEQMVTVLSQQQELYALLVDLSKNMKQAIKENNIKKIDEIVQLETALTMKLSGIEKHRAAIASDLVQGMGMGTGVLRLNQLQGLFSAEQNIRMERIRKDITERCAELQSINQSNNMLIENRLQWVKLSRQVMERTSQASEVTAGKSLVDESI